MEKNFFLLFKAKLFWRNHSLNETTITALNDRCSHGRRKDFSRGRNGGFFQGVAKRIFPGEGQSGESSFYSLFLLRICKEDVKLKNQGEPRPPFPPFWYRWLFHHKAFHQSTIEKHRFLFSHRATFGVKFNWNTTLTFLRTERHPEDIEYGRVLWK